MARDDHTRIKLDVLREYSEGRKSSQALREEFNVTFGDLLVALSKNDLPLPRASVQGREDDLAKAEAALFPNG